MTKAIQEDTPTRNGNTVNGAATLARSRSSKFKEMAKIRTKRFQPVDQILGDIINHARILET